MKWIRLEDQKPPIDEYVFIFNEIGDKRRRDKNNIWPEFEIAQLEDDGVFRNSMGFYFEEVTHWMPLPPKPELLEVEPL